MRAPLTLLVSVLGLTLVATLSSTEVEARIEERTRYTRQQAFNGAVRFIRIESQFEITEKDQENSYVLFEYPRSAGRSAVPGSIEVIERADEVALIVQIPQMPEYHERHLADGLVSKLRADYGEPPRREKPDEPEPPMEEPDEDDSPPGEEERPPHEQVPRYRIGSNDS